MTDAVADHLLRGPINCFCFCLDRDVGLYPLVWAKTNPPLQSLAAIAIKDLSDPKAASQLILMTPWFGLVHFLVPLEIGDRLGDREALKCS